MTYHWCNEHEEHPTSPGVTTQRASREMANAVINASPSYLEKLSNLVEHKVLTPYEAKQALLELGRPSPMIYPEGSVIPVRR